MQKKKNQYNIRKAKLTIYVRNNMPWSHKIYAGNAKLFLHSNVNQCNSHINIIKKKNIMILSLEVEIAFDRIQNLVMILKNLIELESKGIFILLKMSTTIITSIEEN